MPDESFKTKAGQTTDPRIVLTTDDIYCITWFSVRQPVGFAIDRKEHDKEGNERIVLLAEIAGLYTSEEVKRMASIIIAADRRKPASDAAFASGLFSNVRTE